METAIPLLSLNPLAGHVRQNGRLLHETSNCRRRIVSGRNFTNVLVQTPVPNAVATWPVSVWAPGFFFCISMFLYVISGIICVTFAPGPTVVYGEHAVPEGATCLRVSRHADYVVAELGLGTPLRIMNLLVNLNSVRNTTTLLLHSTRVSESSTVACTEDVCTDAMLMNFGGPNSPQSLAVGKFRYSNPLRTSTASYTIGLDGEFSLGYGHDYFLTSTHICWEPYNIERVPETNSGLRMDIQSGELFANASDVIAYNGALSSPAMLKLAEGCGNYTIPVSIFPEEASDEARWLGLQNSGVYQTAPDDVDERRNVVETGTTCAQAAFPHAYSLFQLDCLGSSVPCQTVPSVPFRRAATYQLRFAIPTSDSGSPPRLWTVQDSRLDDLPRLNDNAVNTAVIKLVLMILSALVIWVRANKVTASHSSLFMFCLRASRCLGAQDEESTRVDRLVIIEDAAIGLVAIAARFAVSIWRLVSLAEDNQLRAPLMQLLGCFFSFLHWIVRNFVLKHECEVPLTKLGGSTAIIDATSAVMMAFASPPLLVSSAGRFDSTARMLVALIVTTITVPRCLFAASCVGVLLSFSLEDASSRKTVTSSEMKMLPGGSPYKPPKRAYDASYLIILVASAVAWLFQVACVGVLMADLFCTPLAFSMHRNASGETLPTAVALFMVVTGVGLPAVLQNAVRVTNEPVIRATEGTKKP